MQHEHIDWSSSYDLDIEDIDYQHHFFLNLINRLSDELAETEDHKRWADLFSELNAYTRFHFISEENLMKRAGYPQIEQHRQHHMDLLDQLSLKENNLLINGTDREITAIMDFLTNWFLKHTTYEDRLFADFYHQQENT